MEGVVNIVDDILVWVKTRNSMTGDRVLMDRIRSMNLKLNKDK